MQFQLRCPNPQHTTVVTVEASDEVFVCPLCGQALIFTDPVSAARQLRDSYAAEPSSRPPRAILRRELIIGTVWAILISWAVVPISYRYAARPRVDAVPAEPQTAVGGEWAQFPPMTRDFTTTETLFWFAREIGIIFGFCLGIAAIVALAKIILASRTGPNQEDIAQSVMGLNSSSSSAAGSIEGASAIKINPTTKIPAEIEQARA